MFGIVLGIAAIVMLVMSWFHLRDIRNDMRSLLEIERSREKRDNANVSDPGLRQLLKKLG